MSWLSDVTGINIDVAGALAHVRDDIFGIFQGQNVLEEFRNIATTVAGTAVDVGTLGLTNTQLGQQILKSGVAQTLTAGISGDIAGFTKAADDLAHGTESNNLPPEERDALLRTLSIAAAVATAGVAAPSLLPGTGTQLLTDLAVTRTASAAFSKGNTLAGILDIGGALAGQVDDSGDLSAAIGIGKTVNAVSGGSTPKSAPRAGTPGVIAPPYYQGTTEASISQTNYDLVIAAALALIAVKVLR